MTVQIASSLVSDGDVYVLVISILVAHILHVIIFSFCIYFVCMLYMLLYICCCKYAINSQATAAMYVCSVGEERNSQHNSLYVQHMQLNMCILSLMQHSAAYAALASM